MTLGYLIESGARQTFRYEHQMLESAAHCTQYFVITDDSKLTLIAKVQIVAMASKPPFEIRLEGRAGSYSQIAVFVSTADIFVMCDMTSIVAKLTTCARHLSGVNQRVFHRIR